MNSPKLSLSASADEITTLIRVLRDTEERLAVVTQGQVDSVTDSDGRTFLLGGAQRYLRETGAERQLAILNILPANIALIDSRGVIVSVNASWQAFPATDEAPAPGHAVGVNYLAVCDSAAVNGAEQTREIALGIHAVLNGTTRIFSCEYHCHAEGSEKRWFLMTVNPLSGEHRNGAIVMHLDVTAQRASAESLRVSEQRFRQMAENITDVFFLRSADGSEWYYVSPAYEAIWGRSCASLYENPDTWAEAVYPPDRQGVSDILANGPSHGFDYEHRIVRPDGEVRWIHVRGFPIADPWGNTYRTAGIAADVTARRSSEKRIERLNRVYAVLSGINTLIVRVETEKELFEQSCRIATEQGGFVMSWIGLVDSAEGIVKPVAFAGAYDEHFKVARLNLVEADPNDLGPVGRAVATMQPVISQDVKTDPQKIHTREDLAARGIQSFAIFPLTLQGSVVGILNLCAGEIGTFDAEEMRLLSELANDISFGLDHLRKKERLDYIAFYDELTGLANRRLFIERVGAYMRAASGSKHALAVFLLNLERFKNINDSLGRAFGDALLRLVGEWLSRYTGDSSCVARVGADHFAVVLPEVLSEDALTGFLQTLTLAFMDHPFRLDDAVFRVGARLGVAIFPKDASDAESLFRNAEAALKRTATTGDRQLFYSSRMSATTPVTLSMENRLRHALDEKQFVLHYQPKINLTTGELTGAEALIRWSEPSLGLVPPGDFIPVLEEIGMIHEVGSWALRQALEDYRAWQTAGLKAPRIAVNVSPLQLRDRGFIAEIDRCVKGAANSTALELEITESVIMADIKNSVAMLTAIRALGVTVAIDDFGTGFSSLSYLSKLPVDTLKIDRSFVVDMTVGAEGLALVQTIISLAHSLKLNVVAEGVETEEQSRLLRLLGCDEMQGFLFSKPLPAHLFESRFLAPATKKSIAAQAD